MNVLFLTLRVFHVLFGAMWVGGAVLASLFVMPSIQEAGPDGGKVMMAMIRRKFPVYIAVIAGVTVLSGLWLYWFFTGGFQPGMAATRGARVFGAGGVLGFIAAVLAGSGVSRNIKKVVALMGQAAAATDGAAKASLMEEAGRTRQRAMMFSRMVAALLVMTIMLMAVGHYV